MSGIKSFFSNFVRIIYGIIAAFILIFLFRNWGAISAPIEISLINKHTYTLWGLLLTTFVVGNLSWYALNFKKSRQLKKLNKTQSREIEKMKAELDKLRNLSLTDDVKSLETVSAESAISED